MRKAQIRRAIVCRTDKKTTKEVSRSSKDKCKGHTPLVVPRYVILIELQQNDIISPPRHKKPAMGWYIDRFCKVPCNNWS